MSLDSFKEFLWNTTGRILGRIWPRTPTLRRRTRKRLLTPEEAAQYQRIRSQVTTEFIMSQEDSKLEGSADGIAMVACIDEMIQARMELRFQAIDNFSTDYHQRNWEQTKRLNQAKCRLLKLIDESRGLPYEVVQSKS